MTSQEVLTALRAHDQTLAEHLGSAPASLAEDLAKSLPALDADARLLMVAVIARHNGAGTGKVLLGMTDDDLQIAAAAAQALLLIKTLPAASDILAALPKREDPIVRGSLYLALGKTGEVGQIDKLRTVALAEKDPEAKEDAQAAAVKLGGKPERAAFVTRVQSSDADHALRCRDHLMYVGDPALAKALLPWLGKEDGVMRLGSDRENQRDKMVRMKDLAVWTAHNLGIKFKITPEHLTNYDPAVIQECGRVLSALPNP